MNRSMMRVRRLRGDEMKNDFRIGGRLEDRAVLHEIAAQGHAVGEIAVVGDGETARAQLGEQRLDIAQDRLARRRIAHMADRRAAGQALDRRGAREMFADQTETAFGIESVTVEGDDAGRFLAAMLQGVQPERGDRRRRRDGRRCRRRRILRATDRHRDRSNLARKTCELLCAIHRFPRVAIQRDPPSTPIAAAMRGNAFTHPK